MSEYPPMVVGELFFFFLVLVDAIGGDSRMNEAPKTCQVRIVLQTGLRDCLQNNSRHITVYKMCSALIFLHSENLNLWSTVIFFLTPTSTSNLLTLAFVVSCLKARLMLHSSTPNPKARLGI
ncbi:U-box domain-containing protein 33 [Iris pallida]|uniref:U-box domain-containing protein 33 n=1 Tax=Iris pallida TaxID=29817 RepID=A0AAX6IBE2_IRIPA|nr:U-box domain-containing protein 33 [Iris pallida]